MKCLSEYEICLTQAISRFELILDLVKTETFTEQEKQVIDLVLVSWSEKIIALTAMSFH